MPVTEYNIVEYLGRPYSEENQGAITEEEAAFLYGLAVSLRPVCIAEVGTGWYRSLRAFEAARAYLEKSLSWPCAIWSCDIRSEVIESAKELYVGCNFVCGDSAVLSQVVLPAPELIFIDGDHNLEPVRKDVAEMSKCAAPGATIVLHDCNLSNGVTEYCNEVGILRLDTARGMAILRV